MDLLHCIAVFLRCLCHNRGCKQRHGRNLGFPNHAWLCVAGSDQLGHMQGFNGSEHCRCNNVVLLTGKILPVLSGCSKWLAVPQGNINPLYLYRPEAMPYNTHRVTVTPLAEFCWWRS